MGRRIRVRCIETGKVYESMTLAARALHTSVSSISLALHGGGSAGGHHWESLDAPKYRKRPKQIKVRCIDTGFVYGSIEEASKATGINRGAIGSAASGMAGGYRWETV